MKVGGLPPHVPLPDGRPVTVKEYAAAYRVNPKTVYAAIKRGEIPVSRFRRLIRIVPSGSGGGGAGR